MQLTGFSIQVTVKNDLHAKRNVEQNISTTYKNTQSIYVYVNDAWNRFIERSQSESLNHTYSCTKFTISFPPHFLQIEYILIYFIVVSSYSTESIKKRNTNLKLHIELIRVTLNRLFIRFRCNIFFLLSGNNIV